MTSHRSLLQFGASSLTLVAVLFLPQMKCCAFAACQQEQQQSQPQQPPPSPTSSAQNPQPASQQTADPDQPSAKGHKVWTNDDVVLIRTPADNYQMELEAKKAADAKAAAKEAALRATLKSEKQPPLDIKLPATAEETEQMIKNTESDVQEETVIFDKMQKELLDTPAEQQAKKQKEIDHLNGLIETSQRDLKALQDHLQALRAKSQKENSPAAPEPPPAPPTPPNL